MQERGQDDQNQPPYTGPDPYGATRSSSQPQYGQAPQYGDQPGWPGQQPYQPPAQPPKKKGGKILGFGCLGLVALIVIIVIAAAVGGSKGGDSTAGGTPAAAVTTAAKQAAPAASAAAPTTAAVTSAVSATTQAATPQQVVFSCTGSAPDGANITYGPEGTNDSASSLPFTKTVPLDSNAQYYNVTAQLQGGGQVSCTTVVDWDGQSVTQSGTASGGYNIASAEICSTFDGGWQTC